MLLKIMSVYVTTYVMFNQSSSWSNVSLSFRRGWWLPHRLILSPIISRWWWAVLVRWRAISCTLNSNRSPKRSLTTLWHGWPLRLSPCESQIRWLARTHHLLTWRADIADRVACLTHQSVLLLHRRCVTFEKVSHILKQLIVCLELSCEAFLNAIELVS